MNAGKSYLNDTKYRADIDGLRAVAVISVVGFHAFPTWIAGGFIGVDIFFVISGYLISTIIFEALAQNNFSFLEFYGRRIRRIFPALIAVLTVCYAVGWVALLPDEYKQLGKHIAGGAGFVSNFVLWGESGYFDNSADTKPLLHLWSLGIEEQYYIAWPLLLWLAWKLRLNLLTIAIIVGIASFAFNVNLSSRNAVAAFYSPQTRFWELMAGSLLAYITLHKPGVFSISSRGGQSPVRQSDSAQADANSTQRKRGNVQSLLGAALIVAGFVVITKDRQFPGWWALLPTIGAALVIAAGTQAWLNRVVLSSRILVWFGLISFPLYLWHWPLLSFMRILESTTPTSDWRAAAIVISIVLAWLTYRWIETPIRFGKNKKSKVFILIVAMTTIGYLGYNSYKRDGLGFRKSIKNSAFNQSAYNEFVGPHWKYKTNDTCLNRYPLKESEEYSWWFCMANSDTPPTLLLLGTSYANQHYPGFALNNQLNHHTVLSIGTCDPARVEETDRNSPPDVTPCSGNRRLHQQKFIDAIISKSDSVRFAILDGLNGNPDLPYISSLKERIDFLEKYNIKVVVFTPHVRVGKNIRGCFSRPLRKDKKNCELDSGARKKVVDDFQPLVAHLSKTNPAVVFFDQNELLCTNEKCSALQNGMPLFRDDTHHLSEYGSIALSRLFTQWARTHVPEILR